MVSTNLGNRTSCINWTKAINRHGYGILNRKNQEYFAHRQAYVEEYGPIPKGLCVLHSCDNPSCINPKHLFLGTQLENIKDRNAKGRTAVGLKNGKNKITWPIIRAVRENPQLSTRKLGALLGLSHTTIVSIRNNRQFLARVMP